MKTYQDINATAADWAARIDRSPLTLEEEKTLEHWLDSNPRHRGAFMRMRAIALHTERARALGLAFDPDRFHNAVLSWPQEKKKSRVQEIRTHSKGVRFKSRYSAAAVAACAAIVIVLQLTWSGERYTTRRGEVKIVTLADGSVLTLNTASEIMIRYTDKQRNVRIVEGEALFDVSKDVKRPFTVTAGAASVRALGTSFSVQHLQDRPVHVIVREGIVEVSSPRSAMRQGSESRIQPPIRLKANMQAELSAKVNGSHVKPSAIGAEEMGRKLAWQNGRVAFEAETLAEAAEAFARYSNTQIIIDDPAVASREITGLFAANDPVSFARAAAKTLNLKMKVTPGAVHLTQ